MTDTPFPAGGKDPLLVAARVVAIFMMVMMGIAMGALVIALPAVLFKQADIIAELVKHGITGNHQTIIWVIAGVMVLALVPLGLIFNFLVTLNKLIDSVGHGEPFAAENALRLSRMGWLVLAIQVATIPLGALGYWLAEQLKGMEDIHADVDVGFSGNGLVLALVLFILARIFRHGAAMREELEGTV